MWDRALQCLNRDAMKRKTREADACRSQRWVHHLQHEKEDTGESPNGGLTLQWGEKQFLFFLEHSHQWSCWHREWGRVSDWWAWLQMLKHRAYLLLQWWSGFALFVTTESLRIDEIKILSGPRQAGNASVVSRWTQLAGSHRNSILPARPPPSHKPSVLLQKKSVSGADERGDKELRHGNWCQHLWFCPKPHVLQHFSKNSCWWKRAIV